MLKKTLYLSFFTCTIALASCTKEQAPVMEDDLAIDESTMRQPKPGNYYVFKFIDTGDDETAQFDDYVFEFQADGDLIVTTDEGEIINGSWDLNTAETVMTLNLAGTDALEDLDDDDWTVKGITNSKIGIQAPGPDIVQFRRIP